MSKDEQIAAPPKYRVLPYSVREYYTNVGTPHEPKIETHRYILSHVDNKGHHIAFDPAWVEWAEKNGVHDTDYAVAKIRTRLLQKDYRLIGTPEIHTLLNAIEDRDEAIAKLTAERDAAAAKGVVVLVKCKRCREQEERQVMSERKDTKRPEDAA